MADLLLPVGGSGISSDDLTATKAYVLEGYTAITRDSNDEPIAGTMKNVPAIDTAISIGSTAESVYLRMTNGAHIQNASSGYPEVCTALSNFGDVSVGNVLSGQTFTSSAGFKVSGTMTNQGAKTASLNCGGSYTIPAGYHNGSGKITVNSLASQTSANAAAGNIVKDKTAWVNGSKITGTLTNYSGNTNRKTITPSGSSQTWKIPWGYHDGNGYITVNAANIAKSTNGSCTISSDTKGFYNDTNKRTEYHRYFTANFSGFRKILLFTWINGYCAGMSYDDARFNFITKNNSSQGGFYTNGATLNGSTAIFPVDTAYGDTSVWWIAAGY